jgi:tetratricopeptide (TPR) repeat protein
MPEQSRELTIGEALDLGVEFAMRGDQKSAVGLFKGVLIHEPDNLEAVLRLGSSLFELAEYYEAFYWFWRGLKLDPKHPMALTNYGLCISQLGHPEEGLAYLERAVARAEKLNRPPAVKALIYNNLGNTLERLNRHKDALVPLDKGIACDPNDPFPHYNRGIALCRLNRHREALEALERSLKLAPPSADSPSRLNHHDAIYNRAMIKHHLGDLEGGFADYEARLTSSENDSPNLGLDPKLKWQHGESIEAKTVLVHCEQGLGDTIQSLRFIAPLQALKPKEILLITHAAIRKIIDIPGVRVLQPGENIKGIFDCWVAIMSLPWYLGIKTEAEIPPPWKPPVVGMRQEGWLRHLPPVTLARPLRVAICWAGNFQHKNDAHRSIPLEQFAAIFDAPCQFVSIQQMREGEEPVFAALKAKHPNLTALKLDDFRDTAAVFLNCDLVVTVDTGPAHLAASLGVPTWILLPAYNTDWRWQLERTDSPWYPSARLFRQPRVGDWDSVLTTVHRRLTALSQGVSAAA